MPKYSASLLFLSAALLGCYTNSQADSDTPAQTNAKQNISVTAKQNNNAANAATTAKKTPPTVIQKKQAEQNKVDSSPWGLALYRPTYILPAYYTGSPDRQIYQNNTPDNQTVDNLEFKAQLSFQIPIVKNLFNYNALSLNAAYTQVSYWQVYADSQYFRETDYEPELFISKRLNDNQQVDVGVDHQSNGQGGNLERSWNRAYVNYSFSGTNWMVAVRPWIPIFKAESSDIHNPNIYSYLGYGWVVGAYKFHNQTVSLMLRNIAESGFQRGAEEVDWSFPIHGKLNFFVQLYSGYGQSLIEYNHYTNSVGVGIALNNWI